MNELQVFTHTIFGQIRTLNLEGDPWFVTADACHALSIGNSRDAVRRLDDDEKGVVSIDTPGGRQTVNVISEAGLYTLVLGSRKPEARTFKRWITHDVIPAIRKHGAYATPAVIEQALTDPDSLIRILTALRDERTRRVEMEQKAEALTTQLVEAQPKIQFADDISVSHDTLLIREFAKLANNAGYPIGEHRMFSWLREQGVIMKSSRDPYQQYIDAGWFVVEESSVFANGYVRINRTTRVTGLGQVRLLDLMRRRFFLEEDSKIS